MDFINCFIYLIGNAGTGKFEVARELSKMTGIKWVDNHLINSPVFNLLHVNNLAPVPDLAWEQVSIVRQAVFTTIAKLSPKLSSFVFTNELMANETEDAKLYQQVKELAKQRQSFFVPIYLSNELSPRGKAAAISVKAEESTLFVPEHPHLITLDTAPLTVRETTTIIVEKVSFMLYHEMKKMPFVAKDNRAPDLGGATTAFA